MCSTPEPITTSCTPAAISAAAKFTACWAEPHWRSTVVAGVSTGSPACSQALRATLNDLLAVLLHAAGDDVLDLAGVDPGALDHLGVAAAEQLVGVGVLVVALLRVAAADRRAHGLDDHDLATMTAASAAPSSDPDARAGPGCRAPTERSRTVPKLSASDDLSTPDQEQTLRGTSRNRRLGRDRVRAGGGGRAQRRGAAVGALGRLGRAGPRARLQDVLEARRGGIDPDRVQVVDGLDDLADATFLVEAVVEHHGSKASAARRAGRGTPAPDAVLATTTSSLSITELAARERSSRALRRPARVQPGAADEAGRARVPAAGERRRPASGPARCATRSARPPSRFRTSPASWSTGCCSRTCSAPSS